MGARSSSTKNWRWTVAQRRCLNGSTIPPQGPTLDAKLAARVYQIDLHYHFVQASLTVEKAVLCYQVDRLVASLLSFCCCLQCMNFVLQGKNAVNEAMDWCVQIWCCDAQSASEKLQLCEPSDLPSNSLCKNLAVHGGPQKPQNCQNWGVGACAGIGHLPRTIRYFTRCL